MYDVAAHIADAVLPLLGFAEKLDDLGMGAVLSGELLDGLDPSGKHVAPVNGEQITAWIFGDAFASPTGLARAAPRGAVVNGDYDMTS